MKGIARDKKIRISALYMSDILGRGQLPNLFAQDNNGQLKQSNSISCAWSVCLVRLSYHLSTSLT